MNREDTTFLKRLMTCAFITGLIVLGYNYTSYTFEKNILSNKNYYPAEVQKKETGQ